METYHYIPGTIPLVISMPHTGTDVPAGIVDRFTPDAKHLPDTDWHIDRLYDFARDMGAHIIIPRYCRYVIDLNRPPDDTSLYPGKFTTGLVPMTLFDGSPIYEKGHEPDAAEIKERIAHYWKPYHDTLADTLAILRNKHKKLVLFEAHSIRSQVSTLFDGTLPDLNLGTADGTTADAALSEALFAIAKESPYSAVLNGRFKGGYITRQYGRPKDGIHAIQLELAQKNYMQETHPFAYDEAKARQLQATLKALLGAIVMWIS